MNSSSLENIENEFSTEEIRKLMGLLEGAYLKKKQELETSHTLYKFYNEYHKYISSSFSKDYLTSVEQSFKHLIRFFGEEKKIIDIRVKDVENFKIKLSAIVTRGYTTYLRTIKAPFNKAFKWEYIETNPFTKIKIKKSQQLHLLFISREELQLVLNSTLDKIMKYIFIFAFNSGCRLNEIVNLKWTNIDLGKELIQIGDKEFTTKNKKQRVIPFSIELKTMLPQLKERAPISSKFVFCKQNGFPYSKDHITRYFKKMVRKGWFIGGSSFPYPAS